MGSTFKSSGSLVTKQAAQMTTQVTIANDNWENFLEELDGFCDRVIKETFLACLIRSSYSTFCSIEVSILLSDDDTLRNLNLKYRKLDRPTNVLSFANYSDLSSLLMDTNKILLLGDIVISYETIIKESEEFGRLAELHFAHMLVHGMLHLLGFNHEKNSEAIKMESLELKILKNLGYRLDSLRNEKNENL